MSAGEPADPRAGIHRGVLLAILVISAGIGILAMNMVLPSLPSMAREFATGYSVAQYVLTFYLFALAFAQLGYGSVSDRFGRRPVMIAGLTIFVAGCVLCAVASSMPMLLAGRIIQGAGGCVGMVLCRAILRDLFDRDNSASLLGYVTIAIVVAPMIGPAVGGLFEETLGWRAGMIALVAVGGAILLLSALWLPETHYDRSGGGFLPQLRSFAVLARNPLFVAYSCVMAFTSATFFGFLAGSPYIVIEIMGRTPGEFGLWSMTSALSYMVGNFVTARHAVRIGTRRMMLYGVMVGVAGAFVLIGATVFGPAIPLALFGPMMIIGFANGLVMASAVASSVSVRPDLAGAAAGLSGFLQIGVGALATIAVGLVHGETAVPMAILIAAFAATAVVALLVALRYPDPVETPRG